MAALIGGLLVAGAILWATGWSPAGWFAAALYGWGMWLWWSRTPAEREEFKRRHW